MLPARLGDGSVSELGDCSTNDLLLPALPRPPRRQCSVLADSARTCRGSPLVDSILNRRGFLLTHGYCRLGKGGANFDVHVQYCLFIISQKLKW